MAGLAPSMGAEVVWAMAAPEVRATRARAPRLRVRVVMVRFSEGWVRVESDRGAARGRVELPDLRCNSRSAACGLQRCTENFGAAWRSIFCDACNPMAPAYEFLAGRHHGECGRTPARLVDAGAGCRRSRLPALFERAERPPARLFAPPPRAAAR